MAEAERLAARSIAEDAENQRGQAAMLKMITNWRRRMPINIVQARTPVVRPCQPTTGRINRAEIVCSSG